MAEPGYWMYETSGLLRPVMQRYLTGEEMSADDCAIMRAYLRQWITFGDFRGPEIDGLRDLVSSLTTRPQIERWIQRAEEIGVDPL